MNVVVVDDDARYRELAAEPFRKRGDRVRTPTDGIEALKTCIEETPDVILTDVQMPRMDGWQLLRLVRSRPALASVPVVFLTALDGDTERLRGYQLGVDAYIPKPYDPQEMLVRVHRIVRRAKQALPRYTEQTLLRGELEYAAPASLLSFLSMEQKTGVLVIIGPSVARVFFRGGRALRAEVEGTPPGTTAKQALMTLLDWTSGQFEFTVEDVDATDEIRTDVTPLILEHARTVDEKRR